MSSEEHGEHLFRLLTLSEKNLFQNKHLKFTELLLAKENEHFY